MNRKRKILLVLALAGFGAWMLFLRTSPGDVQVRFAGVSPRDSNRVVFIITNRSQTAVYYRVRTLQQTNDGPMAPGLWLMREDRELRGQSAVHFEMAVVSARPWKMRVTYFDASSAPLAFKARTRLAQWTYEHGWERLSLWLDPKQRVTAVFGPDMLGHKLAPPSQP